MANNVGPGWVVILGHSFERRALVRLSIVSVLCLLAALGLYHLSSQYLEPVDVDPLASVTAKDEPLDELVQFKHPLQALIARPRPVVNSWDEFQRWHFPNLV